MTEATKLMPKTRQPGRLSAMATLRLKQAEAAKMARQTIKDAESGVLDKGQVVQMLRTFVDILER